MQRHIVAIPVLCRQRFLAAEIELAVDIIFNQHHLVARQQRDQLRFFLRAEGKAERVLPVGHQPAGFNRVILQRLLQRVEVNALFDIGRHRQRLQAQPLQRLQRPVEAGVFHNDPIARFSNGLQAKVQRLQRSGGDDDFIRRDIHSLQRVAAGNGMAEFIIPRRQVFNHAHGGGGFADLRQRAVKLRQRKQARIGKSGGKGQHGRLTAGLQHLENVGVDINGLIARHLGGRLRLALFDRLRRDIIAGLRAGNDPALAFQQLVGVTDGHETHPAADHLFPQ